MKFKGIIFDFNGVLLWDSHLHVEAWQQFALKFREYEFDNNELRGGPKRLNSNHWI